MANTLDPMDIKQIISLHLDSLSNRQIGDTLGISRNTVNSYIKLIKASDYKAPRNANNLLEDLQALAKNTKHKKYGLVALA